MPTTLALVGRTNVGKSTLFNRFAQSTTALTADTSGVTRDRHKGSFQCNHRSFAIIDTGGLDRADSPLLSLIQEQVKYAIKEADCLIFVVDARSGLLQEDQQIAAFLRTCNKPILGLINKVEGQLSEAIALAEFTPLGLEFFPVSALQGKGFSEIYTRLAAFKETSPPEALAMLPVQSRPPLKISIIGRPNTGKSTLVNCLLRENRQIVSDLAGTTRDSIEINFQYQGNSYILVDTAGIRRTTKVVRGLEMDSVRQSLQALRNSVVVIFLIDAQRGVSDQDLRLLQRIVKAGRALVILCNKWDTLGAKEKADFQANCKRRLRFVPFSQVGFISGLNGTGVSRVMPLVEEAYQNATAHLSTPQLTRLLQQATYEYAPPRPGKLLYAHPGGYNPPIIVIHGRHVSAITSSYVRYLNNFYQKQLKLIGTPLQITFKDKQSKK